MVLQEFAAPGDRGFGRIKNHCGQATKSVWGMSWRWKAEGRGRLRKVRGSCQTSVDPGIPEQTQGTETSQYLEEEKETSISLVVASEREIAQTPASAGGLWGGRRAPGGLGEAAGTPRDTG